MHALKVLSGMLAFGDRSPMTHSKEPSQYTALYWLKTEPGMCYLADQTLIKKNISCSQVSVNKLLLGRWRIPAAMSLQNLSSICGSGMFFFFLWKKDNIFSNVW